MDAPTVTIPATDSSEQPQNPKRPRPGETFAEYMRRCPEDFIRNDNGSHTWNPAARYAIAFAGTEEC